MANVGDKFIVEVGGECDVSIFGEKAYQIKGTGLLVTATNLKCFERHDEDEKANVDFDAGYLEGIADVLKAIRKTAKMESKEREKYFGVQSGMASLSNIILKFGAEDIIEAVKAYDEKKKAEEEIKVGDEVLFGGIKSIVVKVWNSTVELLTAESGVLPGIRFENVKKTGRHFPQIAEILEKMRGE